MGSLLSWNEKDKISMAYTMNLIDAEYLNMKGLKIG